MPSQKSSTILSDKDQQILNELREWVLTAEFRNVPVNPAIAVCVDQELSQKQQRVAQMDLVKEVRALPMITKPLSCFTY